VKSRLTRSGARTAVGSALVVKRFLALVAPLMPCKAMRRATWSRPPAIPALWAAFQSLRRP